MGTPTTSPSTARRPAGLDRPPTVATVADRAGVSRQTVSNVVNAPERVLPATRLRVQRAIDELGYRPSRLGTALRSRTTRTFGYRCHLSEDEENLLLDRFLHDLCRAAAARQHHIVLISPVDVEDELASYHEMYRTGSVDGFVLSGTFPGDTRLDDLDREGVPYVSFGRNWDRPGAENWVDIDGGRGIADAVQHFWSAGHRRIAWAGAPSDGSLHDRRAGYRSAMASFGGESIEIECRDEIGAVAQHVAGRLASDDRPTAFVCATDTAAVGCAQAAAEAGLRIGRDVGIIGFDDTRLVHATSPSLSSVRQPTGRVAQLLVDGLIALRDGGSMSSAMLTPTLVHRGTS